MDHDRGDYEQQLAADLSVFPDQRDTQQRNDMSTPIYNGDHAEFERQHADTKPEDRPDWPLRSFDACDWAKAFCKQYPSLSEEIMIGWFASSLMRGFDERSSRQTKEEILSQETKDALEDAKVALEIAVATIEKEAPQADWNRSSPRVALEQVEKVLAKFEGRVFQ